ncbi:MAG: glutamate racemase [Sediminibacterium sp. Gen4]|jgi:glutamate racemase|uniref:glutamate racemase n=1 Tax=unclassified Sediminibacterium TaxID=2635961 RepID=UPI0015BA8FB7|nr:MULTISPECIES: glutamate racemase [unclassified Sediminibacterium]MBW0161570.1 glutamate racemase [Sediminibacterium sp.]MBW0163991.1 glutamate racemase [Sediminibacterium sp.]NWK65916.1 glutamate racemase [Sediminibacterium sp. Gen4]
MSFAQQPIGVFDSGYGGLTILKELVKTLPEYDYLYMGDNARAPYGPRSFDTVYQYTLQCVQWFFDQGCELVVLACNTASAKALRTIQQKDLPKIDPRKRVLGVIRPTTEVIGHYSKSGSVGILGTTGTVISESYPIEIAKFFPSLKVYQEACPMWVPLVENHEYDKPGADYFIQQHLNRLFRQAPDIDTLLLACTHYPLLMEKIQAFAPAGTTVLSQGTIVAASLKAYLHRHPEMEKRCSKQGTQTFYTTDSVVDFDNHASIFFGEKLQSTHLELL